MIDTLVTIALAVNTQATAPRPMKMVVLNTKPVVIELPVASKPESLTTCYQNAYGSCWSE